MGRFQIPYKGYIRSDDNMYSSAFQAIEDAVNRVSDQANVDPTGASVAPPSQVAAINVVEAGGIHDIMVSDQSPAYQGIQYSAYYSQTPDFANAHRIDLGESQNHRANLGPGKYYWAATSKYSASGHSPVVVHGGATPAPVGSGDYSGPAMQPAQGFNTPFRGSLVPPTRK